MWSFGRYNLRLSEDEFWGVTPAEFVALVERYKEEQTWLNWRAALVCAVLANIYRDTKRKSQPFTPEDFMPGHEKEEPQTVEQMESTLKMLTIAHGGKFVEKKHGKSA